MQRGLSPEKYESDIDSDLSGYNRNPIGGVAKSRGLAATDAPTLIDGDRAASPQINFIKRMRDLVDDPKDFGSCVDPVELMRH